MVESVIGDTEALLLAGSELVIGGQKSGKSRRAEALAGHWLAASRQHGAFLLATARADDAEMAQRIELHRRDRARSCPGLQCVEEPLALAQAVRRYSRADTLVLVDCLTLWLTNCIWRSGAGKDTGEPSLASAAVRRAVTELEQAIGSARGPLVLVSNEIGQGVIPLGPDVRVFVDALGQLNQLAARCCARVTWMVAGLPVRVKGA